MSADVAVISPDADQPYWDALAAGRLVLPQCKGCGRWRWPAVWRCGDCGSWDQSWRETRPTGEIYTWSRNWHPFPGVEALNPPFVSVVVTLDDAGGRRMTGLLEGDDTDIRIGARVRGRVEMATVAGLTIPALRWRMEPA